MKERQSAYIQILFHNVPLGLITKILVDKTILYIVESLMRVEVDLGLPVHSFVVHLSGLGRRILLDFAETQTNKQTNKVS